METGSRRRTVRLVAAVLCSLAGATALVSSAFGEWADRRDGIDIPLDALWQRLGSDATEPLASLFVPLAVAAVLALVGVGTGVRVVVALAMLVGLATAGLFLLEQSRGATAFDQFHQGLTNAAGGTLLLFVSVLLLPGRAYRSVPSGSAGPGQR
ncbi:hypothetical protein [Actinophytocola oryzae]|uniref:Membrane protein YphA (DoxX/SURF4 family) n=1 Tax=Actinophytocola oryzae TaxID=502181 RepID=A0A4R7V398_9PSEU|nr:hypothetical protein [Actinophytocola oryzae]TDV43082.1 hypothetical protein CLV71_11616 [Actinophytocola oryzae]